MPIVIQCRRSVRAPPGPFSTFNREERYAVAILFGLLTRRGNLAVFAHVVGWEPRDLEGAEVSVEWTYLRDLWFFHSVTASPAVLRAAILSTLQPDNAEMLQRCAVEEFNSHFGAVPAPSRVYVQSPSNWSLRRFDPNIVDDDAFRRTCRYKWAFNVKPDLVVQTPSGRALCVEAKWDSREGRYPSNEPEKAIFRRRSLPPLTQTEVQRFLVDELLGLDGSYLFLARSTVTTNAGRSMTWAELLPHLDRSSAPEFVQRWCDQEIRASTRPHRAP